MNKEKQDLIQKINNLIAPEYKQFLIDSMNWAINTLPNDSLNISSKYSKFGGLPLLPKSIPWPREGKKNIPYSFILQIHLDDIPFNFSQYFPCNKGILYFFINLNSWHDGKVIFYNGDEALNTTNLPEEILNREKKVSFWKSFIGVQQDYYHVFEPFGITFSQEYQIPTWDSIHIELFKIKNNLPKNSSITDDEAYFGEILKENVPSHQLFGYYSALQEASYEMFCLSNHFLKNKTEKEMLEEALNWVLLFQLDSDPKMNIHWADGGKYLFFIHKDDLKKMDFNKIVVTMDTA